MTYKYKIQSLYPKKYNTQQKTTYHILTPKYNTPNNHIHKYKLRSLYPTKYKLQNTNLKNTQPIPKPKYNTYTQNQKHVKEHYTLKNKDPNSPSNSK